MIVLPVIPPLLLALVVTACRPRPATEEPEADFTAEHFDARDLPQWRL